MDKIIETLEEVNFLLGDYACLYASTHHYEGRLERIRDAEDKLTVLIDQFKDARKEVDDMIKSLKTHNTEGEPVAHLVQQPACGETLSDSSSSEEDDLPTRGGISDLVLRNVPNDSDSDSDFDPDEDSEEELRVLVIEKDDEHIV